jgi:hypothetical protein
MSRKNHSALWRALFLVPVLAACSADAPETVVLSTTPGAEERAAQSGGSEDGSVQYLAALDAAAAVDLWNATVLWNETVAANEKAAAEAVARARPSAPSVASSGTVNGYPCGGALPPCRVLACESGGNPTAENPTSTASGLWQITDGTWGGAGGYSHASHAPVSVQNAKAAQLWAGGAGASHWSACL